jgi:murein DD-endopeptidase MepM/ murein hydrolase activator NlpD
MGKHHYTFLVFSNKKDAVRKVCASAKFLKCAAGVAAFFVLAMAFLLYDYVQAKKQELEFENVRKQAESQADQINSLAGKVMDFEKKMEYFRQLDQKIRSTAGDKMKHSKSQMLGIGGIQQNPAAENSTLDNLQKNMDRLLVDAEKQEKSFKEVLEFLKKRESILAATPSLWPVKGWVTSYFGYRHSPYGGGSEFHKGIDIAARAGNPIIAPADGIVAENVNRADMGNYVVLNHKNGISTSYAHMLRSAVYKGKNVKKGEVIGYVGNSGRSTGSHLHYSVMLNGVQVNPSKYLQN